MSHPDLLIEIGTEELPAKSLSRLSERWQTLFTTLLTEHGFDFEKIQAYATPRRLALQIKALSPLQPAQTFERRGPALNAAFTPDGKPTPATLGFAKSCETTVETLEKLTTDKGEWLVFRGTAPGKSIETLLQYFLDESLKRWALPKTMHWGDKQHAFIRPVRWLTVLYGDKVLPVTWFNQTASAYTYGHRFHHPEKITLKNAEFYENTLEATGFVIPCFDKRRALITQQMENLAKNYSAALLPDPALLDEVIGLVEWPQALLVNFEKTFLNLPNAVLLSAMREHQRCFALTQTDHQLLPCFITISNIESTDPQAIIAGNERVMRARFSDAAFFYGQDQKQSFPHWIESTHNVTFQQGLGTLFDKTQRLMNIMAFLFQNLSHTTKVSFSEADAARAAQFCKADLMSHMVSEFPELQGIMGEIYAQHMHEQHRLTPEIAIAIREHYLPRHAQDELPTQMLSAWLAIADRIDTLVGIFSIGKKPTGEKDPFGLRRAAIGLIRIIIEKQCHISLDALLTTAEKNLSTTLSNHNNTAAAEVKFFILERLQQRYREIGLADDLLQAVLAIQSDNLYDIEKRLQALQHFLALPNASQLIQCNKRVAHLLAQETTTQTELNKALLIEPAEKTLQEMIYTKQNSILQAMESHDYVTALSILASFAPTLDAFFETILVRCEDMALRHNRLTLLKQLQLLLQQVANLTRLT